MGNNSIWAILAVIIVFSVAIVYEGGKDSVDKGDFAIVEEFTKDIIHTIIDDSTYQLNIDVMYVGKKDGYDVFKSVTDSLPNGLQEIVLSVGLTEENKELYILSK